MRRRRRLLAGSVLACVSLHAGAGVASPFDAARIVAGVGGGVIHVDLADPDRPGATFGTRPRVDFHLGWAPRPEWELGAGLGLAYLGQSDSLNAVLRAGGGSGAAVVTHVAADLDLRWRWLRGEARWAPFVRAGAGIAWLSTSAPGGLGGRSDDPAWTTGIGLDCLPHRRLLLRGEAIYLGQATADGARHHVAATVALLVALVP